MHVHYLLQMEKTGLGPPGPLKQTFPQRCLWAVWAGLTGLGDPGREQAPRVTGAGLRQPAAAWQYPGRGEAGAARSQVREGV